VAGRHYPRTWPEFQRFFPDEEACLVYLEHLRWPHGFHCPSCAGSEAWRTKRWLLGTHQGSAQPHQLDYYLDEFTFRFNRRRSRHRGLLFYRLAQEAVSTEPLPLKMIVRGRRGRRGTSRETHI
jgi:hypothetical protein